MRKSRLFIVSVFLLKCQHTLPSLSGCKHIHLPWYPQRPTWLQCVRAESSTIPTIIACLCVCVCARVWEWVSFPCLTSTACCLLASSLTQPLDVLLCTPTPWCYISHCCICCLVWTACVVRPEWNEDMTVSYRCRHVVILCLYSQLALNELWLKWWYRTFVLWLIVSFGLGKLFHVKDP